MNRLVMTALAAVLLGAAPGLAAEGESPAGAIRAVELGTTGRVHEIEGALLASQPGQADLALAKDRGVRTVISLRHESEPAGFDERAEAARLGMEYRNVPWAGPAELTDEVFDHVRRLLAQTPRPLLLHCGSGNRVGAVWIPWRVLDGGLDIDAALAEARVIGLVTPEFVEKALAYVERRRARP
jgi:uncharacterized protein (TIGR01244 family)